MDDFYHPKQNFCKFAESCLWLIWYINLEGNTVSYINMNCFVNIESKAETRTISTLKQWKLSDISDSGIHHKRMWSLQILEHNQVQSKRPVEFDTSNFSHILTSE